MTISNHIAPELLRHFANGRMSAVGTELILRHLAVCDYCLELANAFWLAEPENRAAAFPKEMEGRLEVMVLQRIQHIKSKGL
jgi:hypothetical protein